MAERVPPRKGPPIRPSTRPRPAHRRTGNRRALLTGATGFVGGAVLRQLLAEGWEVVAVSRHPVPERVPAGVIQVAADLNRDGWQRWCEGCSAAIHLVGIIREVARLGQTFERAHRLSTERVVWACREQGIERIVHMSALGAAANGVTSYYRTKWAGEEEVRHSGLAWTIFRPSLIFGPGDGFTSALVPAIRRLPVFPVFGDGTYRLQPIAVEEVARCFVAALELPSTEQRVFELGGPEALTFNEVLRRIGNALGVRRRLFHLPLSLARPLVSFLQHLPGPPVTRDQLAMLLAGSTCDTRPSALAFDVPHAAFAGPTWLGRGAPASPPAPVAQRGRVERGPDKQLPDNNNGG
jgi:NADH dehydrogenase